MEDEEDTINSDSFDEPAENSDSLNFPGRSLPVDENSSSNLAPNSEEPAQTRQMNSTHVKRKSKKRADHTAKLTDSVQKAPKVRKQQDDNSDADSGKKLSAFILSTSNAPLEPSSNTLSPIKPVEKTPLQKLLNYIVTYLEKKDPENYFTTRLITDKESETDRFDFLTLREKIESNAYPDLNSLKVF